MWVRPLNILHAKKELMWQKELLEEFIMKWEKLYFKINYQSELLETLNGNGYYSVEESLINHYQGYQV